MINTNSAVVRGWLALISLPLLCGTPIGAQDYVELTATIDLVEWQRGGIHTLDPWDVHIIVGTNCWQMDAAFIQGAKGNAWFTGTNIIHFDEITSPFPKDRLPHKVTDESGTFVNGPTRGGQCWIRSAPSVDGNPGRPVRVMDLLTTQGRIAWLAFCSGPTFRRADHVIFPSNDLWKETGPPGRYVEQSRLFPDELGLPQTVWLQTTNGLALLQYGVVTTTNVCGWDFPREFYLAQSWRGVEPNTNVVSRTGWELQYVAKGRVTSIHAGKAPQIPAEVLSNLAK